MAYRSRYPDPSGKVRSPANDEERRQLADAAAAAQLVFNQYTDSILSLANDGYNEIEALAPGEEKNRRLAAFDRSMQALYDQFHEFATTDNLHADWKTTDYFTPSALHSRITGQEGLLSGLGIDYESVRVAIPDDPPAPAGPPFNAQTIRENVTVFTDQGINRVFAVLENTSPQKELIFQFIPPLASNDAAGLKGRMREAVITPIMGPDKQVLAELIREEILGMPSLEQLTQSAIENGFPAEKAAQVAKETLEIAQRNLGPLGPTMPNAPVDAALIVGRLAVLDSAHVARHYDKLFPGAPDREAQLADVREIQLLAHKLYNARDPQGRFDPNDPKDMQRMQAALPELQTNPRYAKVWLDDDPKQFLADAERLKGLVGSNEALLHYLSELTVTMQNPKTKEVHLAMLPSDTLVQSVAQLVERAQGVQPAIAMPSLPANLAGILSVMPDTPDEMAAFVTSLERRKGQFKLDVPPEMVRRSPETGNEKGAETPRQTAALSSPDGPVIGVLQGTGIKHALTFLARADTEGHPELGQMKELAKQTLPLLKDNHDLSNLPAQLENPRFRPMFANNMEALQTLINDNVGKLNGLTPNVTLPEGQQLGNILSRAAEEGMALGGGPTQQRGDAMDERAHDWARATADARRAIAGGSALVTVAGMQRPQAPPRVIVAESSSQEAGATRWS